MKKITIALSVALAGCGGTVVSDRPVTVHKPVAQPCVAGARPVEVVPLKQRIEDGEWAELDIKQKAAHVAKQALDLRTYGEQLNAVTGGCR